jgi:hypothetical protein
MEMIVLSLALHHSPPRGHARVHTPQLTPHLTGSHASTSRQAGAERKRVVTVSVPPPLAAKDQRPPNPSGQARHRNVFVYKMEK